MDPFLQSLAGRARKIEEGAYTYYPAYRLSAD